MKTKICQKCKKEKSITEFSKNKSKKDQLNSWCKECVRIYDEQYYKANKERYKENYLKWRKENPKRAWVNFVLSNHKRRGYIVNITNNELLEAIKNIKSCPFCGCELVWEYGKGINKSTPTLDRINNEKDINLDNIQILCRKCNAMKQDKTMIELVEWCEIIYKKFKGD